MMTTFPLTTTVTGMPEALTLPCFRPSTYLYECWVISMKQALSRDGRVPNMLFKSRTFPRPAQARVCAMGVIADAFGIDILLDINKPINSPVMGLFSQTSH